MAIDPSGPVTEILDRADETRVLRELIDAGRDVLVYGPRRLGKTSLILHVATQAERDRLVFHVDCTRKETDDEIAQVLLKQLSGMAGRWARFWDWIKSHLEATNMRIVQDGKRTRVELDLSARQGRSIPDALELIGHVARRAKRPALVILDEWQVVMNRNKDGLLWQIRSVSQAHPGLHLLFSGSEPSILARMVDSQNQAYWKGLVQVPVGGLTVHDVQGDLPRHGIQLTPDAITLIATACGSTTLRLIEVLDRLQGQGDVDGAAARAAIDAIVHLHAPDFEQELEKVKPGPQRRCLLGLARDRPQHPTGHEFVAAHDLKTPPSAQAALRRLQDINILDKDNQFVDALFAWYLSHDPELG